MPFPEFAFSETKFWQHYLQDNFDNIKYILVILKTFYHKV